LTDAASCFSCSRADQSAGFVQHPGDQAMMSIWHPYIYYRAPHRTSSGAMARDVQQTRSVFWPVM